MTRDVYPRWRQGYAGEDFDRAQALAARLTEEDRRAGRPAPQYGYGAEQFAEARAIVRAAQE